MCVFRSRLRTVELSCILVLAVTGIMMGNSLASAKAASPAANYIVLYNDPVQVNQAMVRSRGYSVVKDLSQAGVLVYQQSQRCRQHARRQRNRQRWYAHTHSQK